MAAPFDQLKLDLPFVVHDRGTRSLHFTYGELQSRMRDDRPEALEVDYTRTMMGFLLLQPDPRRIAMIGLLGGFITPISLSTGQDRPLALFGYATTDNAQAVSGRWFEGQQASAEHY